jgi:DNA replication protein DnaC/tetratricopeptide (TPR) repeat protein
LIEKAEVSTVDKTEYHLKLEEINRLVDAQDYEGALTVADSIDWRRVKSVRTLCMVADIYEVNGELEKSMQMLQLAHKRSSIGKMILYRQVELALKMGLYDDAVKYYNEYLETASNDTSKYILKYKIYKAQKAPLENQIAILEEYKEREYTERWVYELAKLYKKAGQEKKCVETCDDLVLWFGEGKYVTKAMELKMTYTPLSPSQKEKYEKAKAAGKVAKPTAGPKLTEEVKNTILPGVSAAAMAGLQKVEEEKEQAQEEAAATAEIPQEPAGTTAEETPTTEEEPVKPETEIPHIDTEKLQERLSRSFQEILSGFNRTKAVDAFEALGRAAGTEVPQEPEAQEENMEDYHVQDLEPEAVNEGIISADSGVAGVSRTEMDELEMMEKPKVEKPEDKEIISVQEVDLDALFAETSSSLAKEAGEDAAEKAEEEPAVEEVTAEEIIGEPEEVVAEETVDAAGDVLEERVEGAVETVTEEKEPAETMTDAADEAMAAFEASLSGLSLDFAEETSSDAPETVEPETETSAESTEEPETEEDITGSEAAPVIEMEYPEETEDTEPEIEDLDATRVIPDVTKQDAWHATPGDTQEFNLEEELKAALSGMDELREQEEAEQSASLDPEPETASEEEIAFEEKTEPMTEENTTEESVVEEGSETEAEEPEGDHIDKMLQEAEIQPDISEMTLERETPEEKRQRILNNTRPERLTAEQKQLFSYFAKVPGMDDQILDAIHGAYDHASEKTSHRGNIAIMGSHGTGKTRLSEGLVKAICKELGLKAVKYANLDASDINRKDPATIISKMAGGFLLIERASFMTPETIEKLSQAMDFRTDSMILLIEDDKANMRKMLADYPEFAEKFETVISIPVFTNDELVTFARTYARENGFRMDEMGVLALYTMIGDNQKEDEPITIGKVKEMVDGAIRKASGVKLGRKLSKRHTDADGRILLYEKDFDL